MKQVQKLPDPHGMISRIRARLSKNCAVRVSPYCEVIISMRMQGINFRQIEEWLTEQGREFRIGASTICRNLKKSNMVVELSKAEELAEQWGGRIDLDLVREVSGQIVLQRQRVDKLQRQEEVRQQTSATYLDRRIRQERELLVNMVKTLFSMMKSPLDAAMEMMQASAMLTPIQMDVGEDALSVITEMILNGDLSLAGIDEIPLPNRN